jgi:two-component system response regulator (stage 0 sporulation protein F)
MEGHLLLVDDEEPVREVLSEYFVGQGYRVDTASNGEAALAFVGKRRPDLVLLDVRMEGLDGVEVLRRLRRQDTSLPVIMLTANEDVALARETLSLGAFDYVAKPFDFAHLERVVAAALLHTEPGARPSAAAAADAWSTVAGVVFHAVRGMADAGRRSTGERMETAVVAAVRSSRVGHADEARAHLVELELLLTVAVDLGDLPAIGRDAIAAALAGVGAPPA